MSQQHSTLELSKFDPTTGAPERDHAAIAPEKAFHPTHNEKASPYSGPEKFFNEGPAKIDTATATSPSFDSEISPQTATTIAKNHSFESDGKIVPGKSTTSRRSSIIIVTVIIAAICAAALGIGLGVGLKKKNVNGGSSTKQAPTNTGVAGSSPTSSPSMSTPNIVMSDTSLAALELPNGDRRLFFQDISGSIRQAVFSSSTKQWAADPGFVVASDAKNSTPIAAITTPAKGNTSIDGLPEIPAGIAIFYINQGHSLASLQLTQGAWITPTNLGDFFTNISNFVADPESRNLAASTHGNGSQFNAILFYESLDNGITMLNGTFYNQSYTTKEPLTIGTWTWQNMTSNLLASRSNQSESFAPPFATAHSDFGEAFFLAKDQKGDYSGNEFLTYFSSRITAQSTTLAPDAIQDSIQDSDLLILDEDLNSSGQGLDQFSYSYFWVNGTSLSLSDVPITTAPSAPFPFKRLAGFSPAAGKQLIIYHQLNNTALVEELYDASVGGWVSTEIAITS